MVDPLAISMVPWMAVACMSSFSDFPASIKSYLSISISVPALPTSLHRSRVAYLSASLFLLFWLPCIDQELPIYQHLCSCSSDFPASIKSCLSISISVPALLTSLHRSRVAYLSASLFLLFWLPWELPIYQHLCSCSSDFPASIKSCLSISISVPALLTSLHQSRVAYLSASLFLLFRLPCIDQELPIYQHLCSCSSDFPASIKSCLSISISVPALPTSLHRSRVAYLSASLFLLFRLPCIDQELPIYQHLCSCSSDFPASIKSCLSISISVPALPTSLHRSRVAYLSASLFLLFRLPCIDQELPIYQHLCSCSSDFPASIKSCLSISISVPALPTSLHRSRVAYLSASLFLLFRLPCIDQELPIYQHLCSCSSDFPASIKSCLSISISVPALPTSLHRSRVAYLSASLFLLFRLPCIDQELPIYQHICSCSSDFPASIKSCLSISISVPAAVTSVMMSLKWIEVCEVIVCKCLLINQTIIYLYQTISALINVVWFGLKM